MSDATPLGRRRGSGFKLLLSQEFSVTPPCPSGK
jgi:hypothetical protein